MEIDKKKMIIGAAADDAESALRHAGRQRLGIRHYLFLVLPKIRLHRFFQADSLGCNGMHQRPALSSGKCDPVEILGPSLFAEHKASSRSAQCFVSRSGNKVCMWNRAGMNTCRHETRDMRHIHKKDRTR